MNYTKNSPEVNIIERTTENDYLAYYKVCGVYDFYQQQKVIFYYTILT